MKNILFIVTLVLFTSITYAQNTKLPKTEKKGDLTEVTIYYNNGEIMQHGSYNTAGKLHGQWYSYNEDGTRKCIAFYDYGAKVGTWIYWDKGTKTNVVYDNNKIISIEKVDPNLKSLNNDNN